MNPSDEKARARQKIDAEAACLVVEIAGSADPSARARAIEWAAQSPHHGVAFARAERAWETAERLRAAPPIVANEVPLPSFSRRGAIGGLIAATIVAGFGAVAIEKVVSVDRYGTGIGERKIVTLADGSRVNLNTDSVIEVSIGKRERVVHLLQGEAMFDVVHEAARPFRVFAGSTLLQVLGTAFNVRIREQLVELTVTRGAVGVRSDSGLRRVPAGESAAIRGATVAAAALQPDEVSQRIAWQSGTIALDGQTLEQAVAEFNRYNTRPIVIGDPDLAAIRVGGTFATTDAPKFVAALEMSFPIKVITDADQSVLLVKAD